MITLESTCILKLTASKPLEHCLPLLGGRQSGLRPNLARQDATTWTSGRAARLRSPRPGDDLLPVRLVSHHTRLPEVMFQTG